MASDIGQPESSMASREARLTLALLRVPGIGSLTLNRLLSRFESAEAVFSATRSALGEIPQIPQKAVDQIITGPNLQQIQQDLSWLDQQPGRTLLHRGHPDYPSLLLEIHDPPPVIFVNGDVALLSRPQLAIVGSRTATASGVAFAREIAAQLAVTGIVITSGLATGIDAAAHQGALQATGKTIAVTGTGPDKTYPASNRKLAEEIQTTGALVSEYPVGTPPLRENFPRRNRIISGLSLGVLVVEAGLQSGSLITARLALEQGREVFAVPGSVRQPTSRGCHRLIKQGAKLTDELSDILDELPNGLNLLPTAVTPHPTAANTTAAQQVLLEKIGYDPISMDTVVQRSGLTAAEVSSMLLQLEVQGVIAHTPGGLYQRSC